MIKNDYVEIDGGYICKVLRTEGDTPLFVGSVVLVRWNEFTALFRRVVRIATEQEYLDSIAVA